MLFPLSGNWKLCVKDLDSWGCFTPGTPVILKLCSRGNSLKARTESILKVAEVICINTKEWLVFFREKGLNYLCVALSCSKENVFKAENFSCPLNWLNHWRTIFILEFTSASILHGTKSIINTCWEKEEACYLKQLHSPWITASYLPKFYLQRSRPQHVSILPTYSLFSMQ